MEHGYSTRYLTPKRGVTLTCPETGAVYTFPDAVSPATVSANSDRVQWHEPRQHDVVERVRAEAVARGAEPEDEDGDNA